MHWSVKLFYILQLSLDLDLFGLSFMHLGTSGNWTKNHVPHDIIADGGLLADSLGSSCLGNPLTFYHPVTCQSEASSLSLLTLKLRQDGDYFGSLVVIYPFAAWNHRMWPSLCSLVTMLLSVSFCVDAPLQASAERCRCVWCIHPYIKFLNHLSNFSFLVHPLIMVVIHPGQFTILQHGLRCIC